MSVVKACQKDDIPTKAIKMNEDIFASFIAKDFHNCVDEDVFPDDLNMLMLHQFIKWKTKGTGRSIAYLSC